jgi:hypothetical protein
MAPTQELIDDLYREKVLRARAMTPEERVREGFRLSAAAEEIARAGIRAQYPQADEAEILLILRRRMALARKLKDGGHRHAG